MTTIFCDPTQFGHTPADHARAAALFERLGIEQVPPMIDDEGPEMQALYAGTCDERTYAELTGRVAYAWKAGQFPGLYGVPRCEWNAHPVDRHNAHLLQAAIAHYSQHCWPDCSVDGYSITVDLRRLGLVLSVVCDWGAWKKTIAVAKTFRVSTMAHLTTAEMARYAKRLAKFNGVYPWMAGRWQFRQYSAMPPDYVDYDKPDLVRSRMEFGDKYLNNPQTMVDDSLAEAEKDLTFFKEIFG